MFPGIPFAASTNIMCGNGTSTPLFRDGARCQDTSVSWGNMDVGAHNYQVQCCGGPRQRLSQTPILAFPDFTKTFVLDTDASNDGIGAVLSQEQRDGRETVVAYASQVLIKAERRYCVTRRELLAVVTFLQHFRPCLLGRHFVIQTDHGSLT